MNQTNFRDLRISDFEIFLDVIELDSVKETAIKNNCRPQYVSTVIKRIEKLIGKCFYHISGSQRDYSDLTITGKELKEKAIQILEIVRNTDE